MIAAKDSIIEKISTIDLYFVLFILCSCWLVFYNKNLIDYLFIYFFYPLYSDNSSQPILLTDWQSIIGNEENYIILTGAGRFQVNDEVFDIAEASVLRKRLRDNEPFHWFSSDAFNMRKAAFRGCFWRKDRDSNPGYP